MASLLDCWRALRGYKKIQEEIKHMEEEKKTEPLKAGVKSTEFWLHVAGIVGTAAAAFSGFIPPALALKASVVLTVAYTVARTVAKVTATKKDDEFLDALAGKLGGLIKPEVLNKPQDPPKQP